MADKITDTIQKLNGYVGVYPFSPIAQDAIEALEQSQHDLKVARKTLEWIANPEYTGTVGGDMVLLGNIVNKASKALAQLKKDGE